MNLWKCGVCGYIHDGDEAPEKCPKCGAPQDKFSKLDEEAASLVLKSRRTNDIHMELATLLDKLLPLCEEGLEIKLDPGCIAIFEKAKNTAITLRQAIKAEIAAHLGKGKWG